MKLAMFLGITQSLVILSFFILFYAIDFIMIHRYDKLRQGQKSGRSWDYTLLMFVAASAIILQPIFVPKLGLRLEQGWAIIIQVAGIIIVAGALGLHVWARLHLQHFYAERVEVLLEHRVIDTGPYQLIRHPIITSFFGLVIGFFLINPALTTLALLLYTYWDFGHAARQEEELLSQNLPEYKEYMQRTPRFLPRLRRQR
jgi:protein-S-isoprenylcysteine O-methyltransferase Ste14